MSEIMGELKIVVRAFRLTRKADDLIENICIACNKFNLKIDGESEINPSLLLSYIYEKLSHDKENYSNNLMNLLNSINVKNPVNEELDIGIVRSLIKEIEK